MSYVNAQEAQAQLPSLLAKVEAGEEVVIARDGKPVARLLPCDTTRKAPKPMPSDKWSDSEVKEWLIQSHGLVCEGCSYIFRHERFLQPEYDVPVSKGGLGRIGNRTLLCAPCVGVKDDTLTLEELREVNRKNGWMPERKFGALKGKFSFDYELFEKPLPEEELALWEGSDS